MKIIEGDYQGRSGRFVDSLLKGSVIQISTGLMQSVEYKLPSEVTALEVLSKDERRTIGQYVVIVILAITLIGLILAIPLLFIWKQVDFTVGVKTKDGKKFVAHGDSQDWKVAKKFVGIGSLEQWEGKEQHTSPDKPTPLAIQKNQVTQLRELAELRDKGILTEDEFSREKAKLLAKT